MLPLDAAPMWMQVVSTVNAINWIVRAERALLSGSIGDPVVLAGVAAAAVLAVIGLIVGIRAMKRSN